MSIKQFLDDKEFSLKKRELELDAAEKNIQNRFYALELQAKDKAIELELHCAEHKAKCEHEYHCGLEQKRTELAKLDALIEARKESFIKDKECFEKILKDNNAIINALRATIESMSKNMGTNTKVEVIK